MGVAIRRAEVEAFVVVGTVVDLVIVEVVVAVVTGVVVVVIFGIVVAVTDRKSVV